MLILMFFDQMHDVFLISHRKKLWCNFRLFCVWFLKLKQETQVNCNKDSIIQACNFIKKRLQHKYFPVINVKFYRTPILKNICEGLLLKVYLVLLFWFRRYFSSSSLSTFCKKRICRSLFSIKLQTFSLKFY